MQILNLHNHLKMAQDMKSKLKKRINYILYLILVLIIILIGFNIYFTYKIHNQLRDIVRNPGRWPADAYIFDEKIGFDFAGGVSDYISDGSFYVKSHQLGYRIDREESVASFEPGGVMSLGCSFTYGDLVESGETFTQVVGDSLGLDAYNYGISSFSYIHALLKAEKMRNDGTLDKLKPAYVILGCWSGLLDRSRAPIPPIARSVPLVAAHLVKEGDELIIHPPENFQSAFEMISLYRKEGTGMSLNKFFRLFAMTPSYVHLFLTSDKSNMKAKKGLVQSDVSDFEVYDFYFSSIKETFAPYGTKIIVLHMPYMKFNVPDQALIDALKKYPEIILVDGLDGIREHDVADAEFERRHPKAAAHQAYAWEVLSVLSE